MDVIQLSQPTYKNNSIVGALQIADIVVSCDSIFIIFVLDEYPAVLVSREFIEEYDPKVGDYFLTSDGNHNSCCSYDYFIQNYSQAQFVG